MNHLGYRDHLCLTEVTGVGWWLSTVGMWSHDHTVSLVCLVVE